MLASSIPPPSSDQQPHIPRPPEVNRAIVRDDADVRGYVGLALLDGFEWDRGYGLKFGLHRVDAATLERAPKMSANWYAAVVKQNRLDL
jgi:beta-glucosidase/6-phospho-beta-glucosidase/beta-galactosidase